jgi:D-alanine-D-alanine ligase
MRAEPLIAIVHSDVPPGAPPDEQDTLAVAALVQEILQDAGYRVPCMSFIIGETETRLKTMNPDLIFNLVESIDGRGTEIHAAPLLFETMGLSFLGSGSSAMKATTDKIAAKAILRAQDLPTPLYLDAPAILSAASLDRRYILKSQHEDASVGIFADSVTDNAEILHDLLADRTARFSGAWFAEEFIDGREFNLSVMEGTDGAIHVLPPAEIRFDGLPADALHIVDYSAKWDAGTHAFHNTPRRFMRDEPALQKTLEDIALRCWKAFGLRGWARVDFRVDAQGQPYVLEINANPCLAADAGFMAAAHESGLSPRDVILALVSHPARKDTDHEKKPAGRARPRDAA